MIYYHPPLFKLQNLLCLDCGVKKTGISHNFNNNNIAFPLKTFKTEEILSIILKIGNENEFQKIIIGLPFAYEESESYVFIVNFTDFLQESLPKFDFIFWDESNSSNQIREAYKYSRKGFSKKFHQNYDKQSACLILSDFIMCHLALIP